MIKTYAEIDFDNKVINTIKASESFVSTVVGNFVECTEQTGLGSLGMTYNKEKNKFIHPQPYPSWILNEDSLDWESPVGDHPVDGGPYTWNEENQEWVLLIPVNIDL
jgi:hypothetical protein